MNLLKKIPFSYFWILKRAIGSDKKTILDLGCGEGSLMKGVSDGENWQITGVELFADAARKSESIGIYKKVFNADIKELPPQVKNKKYDVVFSSQVIEHLKKEDAEKSLTKWGKMARKRIVVSTPVGFIKYSPIGLKKEKNPLQKHLSGWSITEFINRGYKVHGQGIKFIYGESGVAKKFTIMLPIYSFIAFLFAPLVYYYPSLGVYMVCWKDIQ